ncbi:helix-turn-helix transcriptional regulator [Ekhidna sp.]|uniref:helix-turn-helix domain-containing protein n=1 Tax=Ekhidna sp. TaxID=2608089 RepID=UPI003299FF4D
MILTAVQLNWWMILIFCASLGLFWAYFLATHKRGNVAANRFVAILLLALAILIIRHSSNFGLDNSAARLLYFLSQGVLFLIGPSILFHFQSLAKKQITTKHILQHYGFSIVLTLALLAVFNYREELLNINRSSALKIILFSFVSFQVGHLMVYLFISRKEIVHYEAKYGQYHTATSRINLRWMKGLIRIISLFSLLILAMYFLILSGGYYSINNNADLVFLLAVGLIVIRIVVTSWRQPEVASGIYQEESKYKNSPLSSSESTVLKEKLDRLVKQEKVFKTPELNLNQLAKKLEVPAYILSQLINQEYNKNFFNFINDFRIEFASQKIKDGDLDTLTLVGVAYEAGFNSKSTFNRAFKKKMGCTPKEYSKAKRLMHS